MGVEKYSYSPRLRIIYKTKTNLYSIKYVNYIQFKCRYFILRKYNFIFLRHKFRFGNLNKKMLTPDPKMVYCPLFRPTTLKMCFKKPKDSKNS